MSFHQILEGFEQFVPKSPCALGYPISLLTAKTAPPCPSKDLRGPAPGHPEVFRVNPDLPRPTKRWDPPSGSPGTPSLVQMKSTLTRPAFPGTFEALPRALRGLQSQPRPAPSPETLGSRLGAPGRDLVLDTLCSSIKVVSNSISFWILGMQFDILYLYMLLVFYIVN